MASLTGVLPKNSYKDLLQVSNSNSGIDSTLRQVSDGEDTGAALYLSTTQLGILTGTAATPSFAFQPDPNTGLWMASTGQMEFVAAGVQSFRAVDNGIRLQDGTAATPAIAFINDLDTGLWMASTGQIAVSLAGSEKFRLTSTGILFVGDEANAKMTQGVTINQGASDDEILALKSSDVNQPVTDEAEADTFGSFAKAVVAGGLSITGRASSGGVIGLLLNAYSVPGTDKNTSASGGVTLNSYKSSGTARGSHVADSNLVVIQSNGTTRFIFDLEGSFHADTGSTTFDAYDDALLGRALTLERSPHEIIKSEWDDYADQHRGMLTEAKILGRISDGSRAAGHRPLVNMTMLALLDHGAIWQGYQRQLILMQLLEEEMPGITAHMQAKLAEAKMPLLPMQEK